MVLLGSGAEGLGAAGAKGCLLGTDPGRERGVPDRFTGPYSFEPLAGELSVILRPRGSDVTGESLPGRIPLLLCIDTGEGDMAKPG